jgi:hypothetical protein
MQKQWSAEMSSDSSPQFLRDAIERCRRRAEICQGNVDRFVPTMEQHNESHARKLRKLTSDLSDALSNLEHLERRLSCMAG